MDGCTLRFTKSSPVQTTFIDEATGHIKYGNSYEARPSHTRIRKFESHALSPPHLDEDTGSDSDDDVTLCGKVEDKLRSDEVEEADIDLGLPESSDEMARIYWELLVRDKSVFQGKEHIRSELLPNCGKMEG